MAFCGEFSVYFPFRKSGVLMNLSHELSISYSPNQLAMNILVNLIFPQVMVLKDFKPYFLFKNF